MTTNVCKHCDHLTDLVDLAHAQALDILKDPGVSPMDAVVWLAAHLAAVERVLHPALGKHLPEGRHVLDADHRIMTRMATVLRLLERHHSGDATAARVDSAGLRDELVTLLVEHTDREHALLDRLGRVLGPDETDALERRYRHALEHAPTRPHPHMPRHRLLGRVAFRLDAVRDRVLDTMDGRHVPTPRPPLQRRRRGAWSTYAVGGLLPDAQSALQAEPGSDVSPS